jgi:DNA-binding NarL/FixJ family response regulator
VRDGQLRTVPLYPFTRWHARDFAFEKANRLKPDVAILDISMPDLDGLQATRQIREAVPTIEVVVLTMHESDQMVRRVLDAGGIFT